LVWEWGQGGRSLAQIGQEEITLYTFAVKAYQDGLYDLAQQQFEQYLSRFPRGNKRGEVYAYLGELYSQKGEHAKAVEQYQNAMSVASAGEWQDNVRLLLGKSLYRLQRYAEAIQVFAPLLDQKGPRQEEALYWSGEAELNQGELSKARTIFDWVLQEAPRGQYAPYAYYARGWIWQRQKELSKALQDWQKIETLFPQSPLLLLAQLGMAKILFALERYSDAEEKFQWVLQRAQEKQQQEEALFGLVESLLRSQRYNEALAAYAQFQRTFPLSQRLAMVLYDLGSAYYTQQAFAKAIELFQEWRTRFPKDPSLETILLLQAQSYQALHQTQKALETYTELLTTFPQTQYRHKALSARGMLFYQLEQYAEARADFETLRQQKNSPETQMLAAYMLGEIFWQQQAYGEALPYYRAVVEGVDVPRDIWYKIGYAYAVLAKYPEAVTALDKYLVQPLPREEQKAGLALLTEVLVRQGNYEEAITKYRVRIQGFVTDPETPKLVQELATLLLRLQRPEEAIATYEQWLHSAPPESDNEEITLTLALLYQQQKDWESAEKMLQTLSQQAKQGRIRAESFYRLAELYAQQGERHKALQVLTAMHTAVPQETHWQAIASYHTGALYEAEQNWQAAIAAYNVVLENEGHDPGLAQAARNRLEQLKPLVAEKPAGEKIQPKQGPQP
jgi:TolA-binding protein